MKKKAGKMFLKGFLQSFFIVAILLGVGILSYQFTMQVWRGPEQEAVVAYKEQPAPEKITEATIDEISKNLIYSYDEDTGEIDKMVLEIFDCSRKQLTYLTIPVRTQFTMSDTLYKKLILVHPAIPQIFKLSVMTKYFEEDTVFEYGVLLAEDLLDIDISYYTVIPKAKYEEIFTQAKLTKYTATEGSEEGSIEESKEVSTEDNKEGNTEDSKEVSSEESMEEDILPYEVFTEDYIAFLKTITSAEELSTYIEEVYTSVRSNLPVYDKMNYLESYCKTPIENISFDMIRGNNRNSAYLIDKDLAEEQLAELIKEVD